jgi:hypothetical protein
MNMFHIHLYLFRILNVFSCSVIELLLISSIKYALFRNNLMLFICSPVQWVPRALTPWIKWPGREADHSSPSNVKNEWSYISTPSLRPHSMVLNYARVMS